tara:strand:- start:16513 stop:18069 length:1557 start_codon:yes stop_codon:yes gene_type:complete
MSGISENSRFISLTPTNGTQFTEGKKVIFEVPPSISFIKGKDSYISVDLERDTDNAFMAHPNLLAGANALIDRVDIFSLENGQLLESLRNYNLWSAIENQYAVEDPTQIVNKQGCMTPHRSHIVASNAETKVLTRTRESVVVHQPGATRLSTISFDGFDKGMTHKFLIPLRAGIFNHYSQEEKLTPNLLYGGLRIEIVLAKNELVLNRVSSQLDNGTAFNCKDYEGGIPIDAIAGANVAVTTGNIRDAQNLGFSVGRQIVIQNSDSSVNVTRNITAIAHNANKMRVTFDGGAVTANTNNPRIHHPTTAKTKYIAKNLELKVLEVIPPQEMMKKAIKESQIDFISYEVFVDNLPASSLNHQVEFPSVATRAKAVFTHYIPNDTENDDVSPTYYAGACPTDTNLNSVQYFINNKLYPLKAYNPDSFNDRIVAYNEIVKAMRAVGVNVKRLGDSRNAGDYSFTYLTARELARGDFVYPLKDAEAQLRTEYSAVRTTNHKLISFVFSVRSVMIDQNNLSVML